MSNKRFAIVRKRPKGQAANEINDYLCKLYMSPLRKVFVKILSIKMSTNTLLSVEFYQRLMSLCTKSDKFLSKVSPLFSFSSKTRGYRSGLIYEYGREYDKKDLATTRKDIVQSNDSEYVRFVRQISELWENAKNKAALAVNTELLDAND